METFQAQLNNFININKDNKKRYPTRDIRVEEQIKNETNLRNEEEECIKKCKEIKLNKESFFNYALNCFNINQLHIASIRKFIEKSNKMQEITGKDYNTCQNLITRDFNGNWTELYSKNEYKRCINFRKQRMSSNTYDFRVQNFFKNIDYPKKQEEEVVKPTPPKEEEKSKKEKVRQGKENRKNTSKIQKQKREHILEQGEVAMILNTAGDSVAIITHDMLHKHNYNMSKIELQTVKYANSLRHKKLPTLRYPPTKITSDIVRTSNYVLISGGRIEYIFVNEFKEQIIKHWLKYVVKDNKIDDDIIFSITDDEDEENDFSFDNESLDESNDETEDEFDDGYLFSNKSIKINKEKKDKKLSNERKFNKNKKKSNKTKYEPSHQYMQELLNRILITYQDNVEQSYYNEEENIEKQQTPKQDFSISFYKPTSDDYDESDDDGDWYNSNDNSNENQESLMESLGLE
jgi:hypothetical protein